MGKRYLLKIKKRIHSCLNESISLYNFKKNRFFLWFL